MTLIFQCLNEGKSVVLVTRHAGDLSAYLRDYRLEGLFDEVHHLLGAEPKSSIVKAAASIFVDDSFSERREVSASKGIPTYDCSMIETLISRKGSRAPESIP